MKKLLTFLLLLAFFSGLKAQISITNAHMPQSGDTLRYSVSILDTAVLQSLTQNGANLNWNFSQLVPQRQGVREYLASSNTPYGGSINNRIGLKLADTLRLGPIELYDVYDFYNNTTVDFSVDYRGATAPTGLSFPFPPTLSITQAYVDKDELYQFPLNYLDRDSSTFEFVYNNSLVGAYYASSGYRINEVDAWGSLTTPFGTFNCIRVVTDVVTYDTISFAGTNFGINSHQREFKWLTTQFGIPALNVNGQVIGGQFIPTVIEYRDSVRNVPSVLAPIALFAPDNPNPQVGDTVRFSNFSISLTAASYQWSINPNTFTYLSGTSATSDSLLLAFTDTGYYDVQLIATNAQGADTLFIPQLIYVDVITGLASLKEGTNTVSLAPNPVIAGEELRLRFPQEYSLKAARLYSLGGRELRSYSAAEMIISLVGKNKELRLSSPSESGVYLLSLETEKGRLWVKFIVS